MALIGGTSESRSLAHVLSHEGIPWIATVTTEGGRRLYRDLPGQVVVTRFSPPSLAQFLQEHGIRVLVDASHPFAQEISQLAMQVTAQLGIPYLRYERPPVALDPWVQVAPDWQAVLTDGVLAGRRVLLTVGVKALPLFGPWQDRCQLWARVLPESVPQAVQAGIPAERVIGMRLPLSFEQELRLWQSLDPQVVISKESGEAGGLAVKQAVAKTLGIPLWVIRRPPLRYPWCSQDLTAVVQECKRRLAGAHAQTNQNGSSAGRSASRS
ncbi:cobalt-precorrin-6A reductase [Synechococcus sp. 60AY4M2]|nr:cobalt-precorrin-6A reductase [Synechococcus sp. 60AY4M2]PIL01320.1 cobalt-precorrin-6A reductase [Synechococcus sp. 65AY640]